MDFLKNLALKRVAQSLTRTALAFLAGYLVSNGIASQDDAAQVAAALAPVVFTIIWSIIEKKADSKIVRTALVAEDEHTLKTLLNAPRATPPKAA